MRFCDGCEKNVYFCSTDAETIEHALAGDCVAREEPAREELPRMVIGRPRVPIQVTPTQREARVWNKRERGIDKVLDGRVEASRRCPSCSYPVLSFRKTCYVCGHEVGRAE